MAELHRRGMVLQPCTRWGRPPRPSVPLHMLDNGQEFEFPHADRDEGEPGQRLRRRWAQAADRLLRRCSAAARAARHALAITSLVLVFLTGFGCRTAPLRAPPVRGDGERRGDHRRGVPERGRVTPAERRCRWRGRQGPCPAGPAPVLRLDEVGDGGGDRAAPRRPRLDSQHPGVSSRVHPAATVSRDWLSGASLGCSPENRARCRARRSTMKVRAIAHHGAVLSASAPPPRGSSRFGPARAPQARRPRLQTGAGYVSGTVPSPGRFTIEGGSIRSKPRHATA